MTGRKVKKKVNDRLIDPDGLDCTKDGDIVTCEGDLKNANGDITVQVNLKTGIINDVKKVYDGGRIPTTSMLETEVSDIDSIRSLYSKDTARKIEEVIKKAKEVE